VIVAFFPKISAVFLMLPLPVIGASLLVSASFMIAGGVQIMTSKNLDSRMTYVIGISLILGIGRKVFAGYFESFPEDLRLLTDTVLSLALISAVALTLIFRLGIKRAQVFVFDKKTKTSEPLKKYLKSHEKEWHLDDELVKHINASTESMVQHVKDVHLIDGPIEVEVSYDEVKVEIKMEYKGTVTVVRSVGMLRKHFAEEEAFVSGISDFLTDVYPDDIQTSSKGDRAEIRMQFDT
jgi:NCS2 family nucleobase:cation symporter-2